jgi:hypothetical protein
MAREFLERGVAVVPAMAFEVVMFSPLLVDVQAGEGEPSLGEEAEQLRFEGGRLRDVILHAMGRPA